MKIAEKWCKEEGKGLEAVNKGEITENTWQSWDPFGLKMFSLYSLPPDLRIYAKVLNEQGFLRIEDDEVSFVTPLQAAVATQYLKHGGDGEWIKSITRTINGALQTTGTQVLKEWDKEKIFSIG